MNRQPVFDAAKALGAKFEDAADVARMDAAIDEMLGISHLKNPTALADGDAFFNVIRSKFGALNQSQVDGFNRLLQAMGKAAWPIGWVAYGLATAWWETAKQMQPVEEGYYLGPTKAKAHQRTLKYYPWYGRGDVQLTWKGDDKEPHYGYTRADKELGLGGALMANPNLALDPVISAQVLVKGMEHGWFTGKRLGDYLGDATTANFKEARRIINGTDKASEIATVAGGMLQALQAGGWR